jgi:GNAT superfamily N-acetyltransferase
MFTSEPTDAELVRAAQAGDAGSLGLPPSDMPVPDLSLVPTESSDLTTSDLSLAAAEGTEVDFMYALETGAPDDTRAKLGISAARIGGGVALSMRNDPTTYWSKALGFGFTEPITAALIDEVIAFYRANDDPQAVLQIIPSLQPANWDEIVAAHGLRAGGNIHRLVGRIDELQLGRSDLRIEEVTAADADEWAAVMLSTFGMPWEGLGGMVAAVVTNPVFRSFGAWDGDRLVATGNLLISGSAGSLHAGATLPEYRGRGAQSGLVAARARAAAAAGCTWVVSETGETGTSFNNMRRTGLRSQHLRRNWIWESGTQSS